MSDWENMLAINKAAKAGESIVPNEQQLRDKIQWLEEKLDRSMRNEKFCEAQIKRLENPWISVDEQLPEVGSNVFVAGPDFLYMMAFTGNFGGSISRPTHWMPMPQPPKIK